MIGALAVTAAAVAAFLFWRRKRAASRQGSAKSLEDGPTGQQPSFQVQPRGPPPPAGPPPLSSYASTRPAAHQLDSGGPPLFSLDPYSTTGTTSLNRGLSSLTGPGTPAMDSLGAAASGSGGAELSGGTPSSSISGRRSSKQQKILDALGMWEVQWDTITLGDCIGKGSFGKV